MSDPHETDQDPSTPTPAAADVPDNGNVPAETPDDDGMETYGSGWARCVIGGKRYRLRRPFMGEYRDLRLRIDVANEEVTTMADQMAMESRAHQRTMARLNRQVDAAQAKALAGADDAPDEDQMLALEREVLAASVAARRVDRENGRQIQEAGDDARIEWWSRVFDTLSQDGTPAEWPAWFLDQMAQGKILAHWREHPLARG